MFQVTWTHEKNTHIYCIHICADTHNHTFTNTHTQLTHAHTHTYTHIYTTYKHALEPYTSSNSRVKKQRAMWKPTLTAANYWPLHFTYITSTWQFVGPLIWSTLLLPAIVSEEMSEFDFDAELLLSLRLGLVSLQWLIDPDLAIYCVR